MIDPHSLTWKTVVGFISDRRIEAIEMLIADKNSEQQRGALIVLDRLLQLADEPEIAVITDDYK